MHHSTGGGSYLAFFRPRPVQTISEDQMTTTITRGAITTEVTLPECLAAVADMLLTLETRTIFASAARRIHAEIDGKGGKG